MAVAPSGRVALSGWFNGTIALGGSAPPQSTSGTEVFIASFDP
jgi:hypothetical protein